MQFRFSNEYQKVLFIIYILWSTITVLRGIELDKEALKGIIFDPWFGGFLYFAPLIMLFPPKLIYIKKIFDVIVILGVFYVIYDLMFLSDLMDPDGENVLSRDIVEYFSKTLSITVAFILLTYTYHSKPKLFYALCILLLTIFFALVRARRGLLIATVGPIFLLYLLYFYNVKKKSVVIILSALVGFIALSIFLYLLNQDAFMANFELMAKRGTEDTRSKVEDYFFYDMEGLDWVIGRGMSGKYYSPTIGVGNYRSTIETDYLNIILKGGSISLVLLLLIIVPAAVLGIFYSKNTLSKAGGLWIIFWIINLYPSTIQVFTLNYLIVWVSVGLCYSRTFRNIPERVLKFYFLPSGAIGSPRTKTKEKPQLQ